VLLLCLAAHATYGQTLVTIGTTSATSGSCSLSAGGTCTISVTVTGPQAAVAGPVTLNYSPAVSGATAPTSVTLTVTGTQAPFLGQGKVTYTAPNPINARQTVLITATAADGTQAQGQIVLNPPSFTVVVNPSNPTVVAGTSQQFTAQVLGISQTAVTWSISPQTGTINQTGLYTAPATVTTGATVKVTATSTFDNTTSGTATITLQSNIITVSLSPGSATLTPNSTQQFTATVANTTNQAVTWSISPPVGTIDQTGFYLAPGSVTTSTRVTVTATSQQDPSKSGTATITLSPQPAVTISITPTTATLTASQTQQFTANVTNAATLAVFWSINPMVGSIDQTGLYTAPAIISTSQKVIVTAVSQADATKSATATITLNPTIDVGTGAPTSAWQSQFVQAFNRNGFAGMVSLPPTGKVTTFGSSGYIQLFQDAAKDSGVTYALASVSPTVATTQPDGSLVTVVQIWGPIYSYFTSLGGVGTVGYPLADTSGCPYFDASNSCVYQIFDKGYALFVYANPLLNGASTFSVNGTFYTQWTKAGGLAGLGRPVTAQATVTASTGTTATSQLYSAGVIYSLTSGTYKGQIFAVAEPIYDLFVAQNGIAGKLGMPIGNAVALANGKGLQQYFEGGIVSSNNSGTGGVQLPIAGVAVNGAPTVAPGDSISMNLGATLSLTAVPYDTAGNPDLTRVVSWSSSNSQVISIQASGQTAVLTAVGGGSATVVATSGGASSVRLSFVVVAPCCQVGDGTPAAVQQAFRNAVARNQLAVMLPAAAPAVRDGNGYVQSIMVNTAGGIATDLIAESDQSAAAYVVAGGVLTRYQALNGPTGPLGYPASDQSAGGTQLFAEPAALAGNPVRLVSGSILTKWGSLGYETGTAGAPAAEVATYSTFAASSGMWQSFANGNIYAATAGPRAGQVYFVGGLILAAYTSDGGPAGDLGMPASDETVSGGVHQQTFEGGTVSYAAGAASANIAPAPRVPAVIVSPASVTAGGNALVAVLGFANNSTLRVSITGQPDFLVTTANGAYSWTLHVPLSAASQTVAIHAVDTGNASSTANSSLTITGFANTRAQLTKVQGDNQSGLAGALLATPLVVMLADALGNPVIGAAVTFEASAGAQLSLVNATTDSTGHASTYLRLPSAKGVAGVTARSSLALAPVTFSVSATASTLPNFPVLQQSGSAILGNGTATIAQKGALLTAAAGILEYHQNRGDVGSPNGSVTPAALNQFLVNDCSLESNGNQNCDGFLSNPASGEQVVNLWRAADFTGGLDVVPVSPTVSAIADLLATGEPLLVSLNLTLNGSPAGGHYVAAIGVNADGSIAIQDPSPLFARSSLNDYLNGFTAGPGTWQAALAGVVRFAVRGPSATRFLVGELSQPAALMQNFTLSAIAPAGACGVTADLLDSIDASGNPPAQGPRVSRIGVCDGLQPAYQIDVGAAQSYTAFGDDLAAGGSWFDLSGSAPATYSATRPQLTLAIVPQTAAFTAAGVVNAATFTAGMAPGGLIAIFGSGLAALSGGSATTVDFDGTPAKVIAATPFQINAQVPPSIAPGPHALNLHSPFGPASQMVTVSTVAPAIFLLSDGVTGAVENQDGTLNGPSNPLSRGGVLVAYATGLGAVTAGQNGLSTANTTVSVVVNGTELPVAYAGLTPGFVGLYQVNVPIPATTPPGSGVSLTLKQGGQLSNSVNIWLQ
jgi:uncharacterized protein (TIGR03437 family)